MSIWTHVAGVVRIDDIRIYNMIPNFNDIFGKEWTFDDAWNGTPIYEEFKEKPELFMPSGSEGSLNKSIWVNPDKGNMAAYTVTIFGDLRDFESPDPILEWFNACLMKINIRQAVITVETEGLKPVTHSYILDLGGHEEDV